MNKKKIKVLFLIHDLGKGGAEKVLVNLVNNMDHSKFDITVMTLFDGGVNRQFLSEHVRYLYWCKRTIPGNSKLMKLLSPERLHKMIVKERYDIEVSYLEGPSARVVSGCSDTGTKLVSWVHIEIHTEKRAARAFRSISEARKCYERFDMLAFVSNTVRECFAKTLKIQKQGEVLYNTNESSKIRELSIENTDEIAFPEDKFKMVGVGKLLKSKGFDRVLRVLKRLKDEGCPVMLYLLGDGREKDELMNFVKENELEEQVVFLGYRVNPYKYVRRCDLFVCASHAEGFSTAATEALIVGTPVCTVEVSGMKEMLGENNEYGIVTENSEEGLYRGIKSLLDDPELLAHYTRKAEERGRSFSTETTVKAVEDMLLSLIEK